jgi:hypothetical protein
MRFEHRTSQKRSRSVNHLITTFGNRRIVQEVRANITKRMNAKVDSNTRNQTKFYYSVSRLHVRENKIN